VPARYGGTFRNSFGQAIPSRDPTARRSFAVVTGVAFSYSRLIRPPLPDEVEVVDQFANGLAPDLAESWEYNAAGDSITLKIRQGVTWQNIPAGNDNYDASLKPLYGREFDAEDAALTLTVRKEKNASRAQMSAFKSATAVDKSTLRIDLEETFFGFLGGAISDQYGQMLPREVFELDGDWNTHIVGTGAYIQTEFDAQGKIRWEKNPDFWREGRPYMDAIEFSIITDAALARSGMYTGQLDWIERGAPATFADVRLFQRRAPTLRIIEQSPTKMFFLLQIRQDKEPWSDVRMRRAFTMSVNWDELIETLQGGNGWMGPPWAWGDVWGPREAWPTSAAETSPWFKYDPDAANALLQEVADEGKISLPYEFPFLAFPYASQNRGEMAQAVAGYLDGKTTGLLAELELTTDLTKYYGATLGGSFDEVALGFSTSASEMDVLWQECCAPGNKFKIDNPRVEELRLLQRRTPDGPERIALLREMWDIERDQILRVPLPWGSGYSVASSRVRNLVPHAQLQGAWPGLGSHYSETIWLAEGD
jgi:peptide/nickel transport system substrate-binding protein